MLLLEEYEGLIGTDEATSIIRIIEVAQIYLLPLFHTVVSV
jgi:hypothetical protein